MIIFQPEEPEVEEVESEESDIGDYIKIIFFFQTFYCLPFIFVLNWYFLQFHLNLSLFI